MYYRSSPSTPHNVSATSSKMAKLLPPSPDGKIAYCDMFNIEIPLHYNHYCTWWGWMLLKDIRYKAVLLSYLRTVFIIFGFFFYTVYRIWKLNGNGWEMGGGGVSVGQVLPVSYFYPFHFFLLFPFIFIYSSLMSFLS